MKVRAALRWRRPTAWPAARSPADLPSRVGVLIATGNFSQFLAATGGHAGIAKPCLPGEICRALEIVSSVVATGVALPPFPRGFRLLAAAAIAADRGGFA
jgi:hypothetical protein